MGIKERREALKELVEAYEKYANPDIPREAYNQYQQEVFAQEEEFFKDYFEKISEPTLEDIAKAISKAGIGISATRGMPRIMKNIPPEKSNELRDGFSKYFDKNKTIYYDLGIWMHRTEDTAIRDCGIAFSRLGIKVDELPEIVLQDTDFLESYLSFLAPEQMLERENPTYLKYTNIVKEIQNELDMKKDKTDLKKREADLSSLEVEAQTITEAENLIEQQQGKQQE